MFLVENLINDKNMYTYSKSSLGTICLLLVFVYVSVYLVDQISLNDKRKRKLKYPPFIINVIIAQDVNFTENLSTTKHAMKLNSQEHRINY